MTNIISLLGGLGAFLFGMKYMGDGLEHAAGPKMKELMETLTRNPLRGFVLGVVVTAIIQSSSATTVMAMGFINAGIMDLAQATGVIIGANIGTTVTSVLIALDISAIAPVCIFVGALLMLYSSNPTRKHIGQVILGFGILFQGLHTMSSSMKFLQEVPAFTNFVASATNPIVGLLVGILMAAVMQSSSAAVGVLQVLAAQGIMPLQFTAYLVCGVNIGSAMPPFLSAIGARNNAKRAAWIYLINNVAGAIIFVPITLLTPYTSFLESVIPSPMFQVSVYHIVFKVVSAIVLMPFTDKVVQLTYVFVPKVDHEGEQRMEFVDTNFIGAPDVAVAQVMKEIDRMGRIVDENLKLSIEGLINNSTANHKRISDNEDTINFLNESITEYLIKLTAMELSDKSSHLVGEMFHVVNDLERIGDHLISLSKKTQTFVDKHMNYSDSARAELENIYSKVSFVYEGSIKAFVNGEDLTGSDAMKLTQGEKAIDDMTILAQDNHIIRLQHGECETEPGIIYAKALHDLERIGDYSMNIAFASRPEPAITGSV